MASRTGSSRGTFRRNGEVLAYTHPTAGGTYEAKTRRVPTRCAPIPDMVSRTACDHARFAYPWTTAEVSRLSCARFSLLRASRSVALLCVCETCLNWCTHRRCSPLVCHLSTMKESYVDPTQKEPLVKYHPLALRNRLPVVFDNAPIPMARFCKPRNTSSVNYKCAPVPCTDCVRCVPLDSF